MAVAAYSRKAALIISCRKEVVVFTKVSFSGKLDSKGRITVPARIRDRLDLSKGDRISLRIESSQIIRKEFDSDTEALNFVRSLQNVKEFSFDGEILEVVLNE